jgi:ABC-type bacteriocin/lantibiotic exporter with double-glycine peptidase domain
VQGETEIAITRKPSTIARVNWSIIIEKGSLVKHSAYTFVLKESSFVGFFNQKFGDLIDVQAIA